MASAFALHFLSLFLLFFMNCDGIGGRDIKIEVEDEKQVDSYKATPLSNNDPYLTASESTEPNYQASYTVTKHNHHHKYNQPNYIASYQTTTHHSNTPYIAGYNTKQTNYIASYETRTHDSKEPYIAGYRTSTHDSKAPYIAGYRTSIHDSKEPYIAGYRTSTHDSKEPYIAGYRTSTHDSKEPYIAGYRTNTHDSNAPYIAGYRTSTHDSKASYIAGYRTNTHDSDAPYTAGYRTSTHDSKEPYIAGYRTNTHDSNAPYIAGYRTSTHDSKASYIAGYRTNTHDSDAPYIAGYRTKHTNDIPGYETNSRDSNAPYMAGYASTSAQDSKKTPKESPHDGTTEPYITQYGNSADSNAPYIAGYTTTSAQESKKTPKESPNDGTSEPYITQYGGTVPRKESKESSNADHTEAFKTGFFALDDLYVGSEMTLQFPIQEVSHFLPRKEADSIPFSMSQLPSVLQLFSIPEDSPQANAMRGTLEQCEGKPMTGETKICATSLESMLEFVASIIGNSTKYNILTTSYPTTSSIPLQKYTILEVSEDIKAPKWVACHPIPYPYAIYYCHFIATGSKVFKVSLGGENGDNKIEALGICHMDTSDWSPDHILFKQLGFMPGQAPVCHFFPVKHLMWFPQPSKATM